MFDISFLEIVLIAVVSLVVLGPDKLPGAIRTVALWIGRLKRSFNNIRTEIEREVGADEIRRQLRNEAIMDKIKSTKGQFTESIQSVKKEAEEIRDSVDIKKEISSVTKPSTDSSNSNTPDFDPAGNASGADSTAAPKEKPEPSSSLATDDTADNKPAAPEK